MIKGKNKEYTIEEFQKICKESESIREVVSKLGYSPDGGSSNKKIKDIIADNNIDISHFRGQGHTKNLGKRRTSTEQYLNNEISISSHKLRLRLIEDGYFEKKCQKCGNTEWLGNPIPLELHRIDGNKQNNNLTNLQILCPNCHVFTDTYKVKNVR